MLIEGLTTAIGGYVWQQRQLAESLSSWVDLTDDAEVAVYLHGTARRFASHSTGWEELLADSPALAAAERVRAPSPEWDGLFKDAASSTQDTSDRLVLLVHIVLPRLLASLEKFSGELNGVHAAAEQRFCAIVAQDLSAIAERGQALLAERPPVASQQQLASTLGRRLADLAF